MSTDSKKARGQHTGTFKGRALLSKGRISRDPKVYLFGTVSHNRN